MATTIINPPTNSNDSGGNGMGFLLGVIILVVFAVLFFVYALPYLRGLTSGGVQVNLPDKVDVNVQQQE